MTVKRKVSLSRWDTGYDKAARDPIRDQDKIFPTYLHQSISLQAQRGRAQTNFFGHFRTIFNSAGENRTQLKSPSNANLLSRRSPMRTPSHSYHVTGCQGGREGWREEGEERWKERE
ncbi:hypothetical protein MPTK1_7g05060 [Marchantia polymorpha subsp. ruderalis]|uniref:Uncharacterized protein n=2 Tax=Marchantia polymorpha TaxID=3197 RepID=A0AAF6BWA4_MARPO|nr:hypothetical protein MARPO_0062s0020 [Marchantia polymorpha]BBN16288.1 hypothetical protein Mp_7g05060 [Marchantia polymorpha subsp. ruderalis]|eukprot:PTQ36594.1 hypothetical protein MARPO_0062s0020 [Marchantia polymorpha]